MRGEIGWMGKEKGAKSEPAGGGVRFGPLIALIAIAALIVALSRLIGGPVSQDGAPNPPAKSEEKAVDGDTAKKAEGGSSTPELANRLAGRWRRVDGGYVIQINAATPSGKLEAAYFNPSPINVSRAEYSITDGTMRVFVELRDRNYPGATYDLAYDPESDCLNGKYNQPLMGQVFEVSFVRMPE